MMNQKASIRQKEITVGDAAVDGLFSGVVAGLAMLSFLVLDGLFQGEGPAVVLSRFSTQEQVSPLNGLLLHTAVSGVYGMLFALVCFTFIRQRYAIASLWFSAVAGGVYGILLWLLANFVLLPGSGSLLTEIAPVLFAAAHLLYGAILGLRLNRISAE